jgi:hypothetical protein
MTNVERVQCELLAEVEKCPFNDTPRLKLADFLIDGCDPRGQLITEQCKPKEEQDPDRIARILREHGRQWGAEDLGIQEEVIPKDATFEFYKGFAWWPIQAEYSNLPVAIAAGKYDTVSPNITATNLGIEDVPVAIDDKLVLYTPRRSITRPRAIYEVRRQLGLPVNQDQIWELCAFGATYPHVQCRFPVVSLSPSWADPDSETSFLPHLDYLEDKRSLYLDWLGDDRDSSDCRFLTVRK